MVKTGPLLCDLQCIRNKKSWGFAFRPGMIEIQQPDFQWIEKAFAPARNVPGDPS